MLTDLRTLLALLGLSMTGLTCTAGCTNGADGGAYTVSDFHADNEKYGVEWDGELEIGQDAHVYAKQSFGVQSPFTFKGKANNHKAIKEDSTGVETMEPEPVEGGE